VTGDTLLARAIRYADRLAVIDQTGAYQYRDLIHRSAVVAHALAEGSGGDLREDRVAYLVDPGFDHVAVQWGIWRAGGIAVPIAQGHPDREIEYLLDDATPSVVIAGSEPLADRLQPLTANRRIRFLRAEALASGPEQGRPVPLEPDRRGLIVYTSGTTGRPKGVVSTHGNLTAQIATLSEVWDWRATDRSLHVLPLHHIHGIINALSCGLWAGAAIEFLSPFDPVLAWERLASTQVTFFTAVPTVYHRLIAAFDGASAETQDRWAAGVRTLRLMLSGSAALPVTTLARWEQISGHRLLERYGMTEIGMGLSNPLEGERRAGTVGRPLPGVQIRLVDEAGAEVQPGMPGQIEIRGPQVFREYWNRPEETSTAFRNGWFMTGDVAVLDDGYYRILGRQSVDIIKSAGYKISALEIEELIREHPLVADCAVVGVTDADLGERISAAVIAREPALTTDELKGWLRTRLAPYKVPRSFRLVTELPRNAMGKVTKPAVRELFE
jgi:malonyl-CoA/methylmalonyl-CoA synthetase